MKKQKKVIRCRTENYRMQNTKEEKNRNQMQDWKSWNTKYKNRNKIQDWKLQNTEEKRRNKK